MKKVLIVCILLALALTSCGKKITETTDIPVQPTETVLSTGSSEITAPSGEIKEAEVKTLTYSGTSAVSASYEVLALGYNEIDDELVASAEAEFARYIPNPSSMEKEGGNATYSVKLDGKYEDEKILSAVFRGEYEIWYDDSAERTYGEVFYTVNIDIAKLRVLQTEDIVSDFDKLKFAFTNGEFDGDKNGLADKIAPYRSEYGIYPYVYFEKDNFCININETGVSETNAQYRISRAEAADFLNAEYR